MIKELYFYFKIKRSGLFDSAYYLRQYPDLIKSEIDPLMHFIKYGWKERRNPSEKFNTKLYLDMYPDVKIADINPLIHYIIHGKKEGRMITLPDEEKTIFDNLNLSTQELLTDLIHLNCKNPPTSSDIIIFPIIDWHFRFQRPQQLAVNLAKLGHRIFYVKTGFCQSQAPQVNFLQENIFLVELSRGNTPVKFYTTLSDEIVEVMARSVQLLKDTFLINSAVMMVDLPFWRKLVLSLKSSYGWKLVYDCMDLHDGFSNSTKQTALDEDLLLKGSDLTVTTSHLLYNRIEARSSNAVHVPNAADYEYFHQAASPINVDEIEGVSPPIIGYYGAIADWFDTDLVRNLAVSHPEWSFVLIGSTYLADLRPIKNLPNIYLLGEKPYSEISGFLSHFDVCIIPFKQSPLTQATNPVKMYEFLSAGKPIVCTKLDEVSYFKEFIRLAETKQEWENAIIDALSEDKTKLLSKRFDFARENTWDKRAQTIQDELINIYPKVSILVVVYNNLDYSKQCLESVIYNTSYPNYEIIIIDNGSEELTKTYLKTFRDTHKNSKIILNADNLGFAKANNQGFKISDGEYIVFLNNDTIVTPGWIHRFLLHLKKNPDAGMVGAVTNNIGNEAQIDIDYAEPTTENINLFAAKRARDFEVKSFKIKMLALFCCMISRELFESVGCLDEHYETGLFEDDDLAMKIQQKGFNCICADDVYIHHIHGATLDNLSQEVYQNLFDSNRRKFEEKWQRKWIPHKYRDQD